MCCIASRALSAPLQASTRPCFCVHPFKHAQLSLKHRGPCSRCALFCCRWWWSPSSLRRSCLRCWASCETCWWAWTACTRVRPQSAATDLHAARSGSLEVLLFVRGIVTSALLGRQSSQTADVQQVEPTGPRRPAACLQPSASPHMMPVRRCFPTLHVMTCKPSQGCP